MSKSGRSKQSSKNESDNLESLVKQETKSPVSVANLSEVAFNSYWYNKSHFGNVLEHYKLCGVKGVIVGGSLLRVDRPEFLKEEDTHWDKGSGAKAACIAAMEDVKNYEQYHHLMNLAFAHLDRGLGQMRAHLGNDVEIYLNVFDDDNSLSSSELVRELLVQFQGEVFDSVAELKSQRDGLKQQRKDLYEKREFLLTKFGGLDKKDTERQKNAYQRSTVTKEIGKLGDQIDAKKRFLEDAEEKADAVRRPKKGRPIHQFVTVEEVEDYLVANYQRICDCHNVRLVTEDSTISVDGFVIDHAHDRELYDAPKKRRFKKLIDNLHGHQDDFGDVNLILEDGHSGDVNWRTMKWEYELDEYNLVGRESMDPVAGSKIVTVSIALPFEDQSVIKRFVTGKERGRMGFGKPRSTKKHNAINRYVNGGRTGTTVYTKLGSGEIMIDNASYGGIATGRVLKVPKRRPLIALTADWHTASMEEDNMANIGLIEMIKELAVNPMDIYGVPGKVNFVGILGDSVEPGTQKFDHRTAERIRAETAANISIDDCLEFCNLVLEAKKTGNSDKLRQAVYEHALWVGAIAKSGGNNENVPQTMGWVADDYLTLAKAVLPESEFMAFFGTVTGNHAQNTLNKTGARETDEAIRRLREEGMSCYVAGENDLERRNRQNAQCYFGGVGNHRAVRIDNLGLGKDGKEIEGHKPIRVIISHDIKGNELSGLEGTAKNNNADYVWGAHTHEHHGKLIRTSDNEWRVVERVPTTQAPAETELYYGKSLTRVKGALISYAQPGRYIVRMVPDFVLKEKGRAKFHQAISEGIDQRVK